MIAGLHVDLVRARLGRVPVVAPSYPRIPGRGWLDPRRPPLFAAIERQFHAPDAVISPEGNASEGGGSPERIVGPGGVNAGAHLDESVVRPPFLLPISLVVVIQDFDLCQPFYVFDPIDPRHHRPQRETVSFGELDAVHPIGQKDVIVQGPIQRNAIGVEVCAMEGHLYGRRVRSGLLDELLQADPLPDRIADQIPRHLVVNALERDHLLDGGAFQEVRVTQTQRPCDAARNLQRPTLNVHRGMSCILNVVKGGIGCDQRRLFGGKRQELLHDEVSGLCPGRPGRKERQSQSRVFQEMSALKDHRVICRVTGDRRRRARHRRGRWLRGPARTSARRPRPMTTRPPVHAPSPGARH